MAFKMKGPSLYKNGALGRTMKVQKDYSGKEDGRATSSPLQQLIPEPTFAPPQKINPASPVQQTAKQAAKLPKEIVNAIAKKQGKSPLEQRVSSLQGEGQDQDKIFNKKGEHVGDYKNGKKVMHTKAQHAKMNKALTADSRNAAANKKLKTK